MDLLLVNGRVRTMAAPPGPAMAQAVAVRGATIVAVGTDAEARAAVPASAEVIDLAGAAVLPGFIETHMHPITVGLGMAEAVTSTPPHRTIGDVVASLSAYAAARLAGTPVTSWGYDDSGIAESRHLTRHDLDRATTVHPVLVRHTSGHIAYVNSLVLERAGIDRGTPDPPGGRLQRDGDGVPTGQLEEPSAIALVGDQFPPPGPDELLAAIERVAARCLAVGVTSVHDLFVTSRAQLAALDEARQRGRLGVRVTPYLGWHLLDDLLDGTVSLRADEWLRLGGVKLIADGSIQGYTACLSAPYFDRPDATGVAVLDAAELAALVERSHRNGLQVAVHTNGDAAIDVALDAIEGALARWPRPDHRHRLEHVQTVREDQLDRIAAAGIHPSVFVNHVYYWGDRHRDRFLGPERASRISPLRSIVDRELPFALHCDCPVTPVDPLFTIAAAVRRRTRDGDVLGPDQRITIDEALRGYTSDAARFSFDEAHRGSVELGKLADLAVLDEDPGRVDDTDIADIGVRCTIVGGVVRYAALMGLDAALVVGAVAAGAFAQAVSGFGFSLIAAPACALVLGPWHGIRTAATLAVVVDGLVLGRERRDLDGDALRRMVVPAVAVVPVALVACATVPAEVLLAVAAVATLAAVAAQGFRPARAPAPPGRQHRSWAVAGMASSLLGITAGLAGPPVVLQALRSGRPLTESRATLAAFFLVVDLAAVVARGPWMPGGRMLGLLAVGTAGYLAGGAASRCLPAGAVRAGVLALAGLAAAAVLLGVATT